MKLKWKQSKSKRKMEVKTELIWDSFRAAWGFEILLASYRVYSKLYCTCGENLKPPAARKESQISSVLTSILCLLLLCFHFNFFSDVAIVVQVAILSLCLYAAIAIWDRLWPFFGRWSNQYFSRAQTGPWLSLARPSTRPTRALLERWHGIVSGWQLPRWALWLALLRLCRSGLATHLAVGNICVRATLNFPKLHYSHNNQISYLTLSFISAQKYLVTSSRCWTQCQRPFRHVLTLQPVQRQKSPFSANPFSANKSRSAPKWMPVQRQQFPFSATKFYCLNVWPGETTSEYTNSTTEFKWILFYRIRISWCSLPWPHILTIKLCAWGHTGATLGPKTKRSWYRQAPWHFDTYGRITKQKATICFGQKT